MEEYIGENTTISHENLNQEHLSLTCVNEGEYGSKVIALIDNADTEENEKNDTDVGNHTNSQCEADIDDLAGKVSSDVSHEQADENDIIKKKKSHSGKLDSEPEEEGIEDCSKSNKENVSELPKAKSKMLKGKLSIKKTKKQLKEERFKIRSETHRLMREREIAIPYHMPKQRTLREFLSRKKNRVNIPLNAPTSKMVEIWKDIEESTKDAFEFFKSDDESDSEMCNEKSKTKGLEQPNIIVKDSITSENSNNSEIDSVLEDTNNGITSLVTEKEREFMKPVEEDLVLDKNKESEIGIVCNSIKNSESASREKNIGSALLENKDSDVACVDLEEQNNVHNVNISESSENALVSNFDENYRREKTSEWVQNIQEYEKLMKPNKKEKLLGKLNPKLLQIIPKLSGEPDSFIELGNDKNDIETGAKILRKRFLENCIPVKSKSADVELSIISSETNDKGEVNKVKSEILTFSPSESLNDHSLNKPGAKLQRLREELKKKIEEKWVVEQKRQTMELELEAINKEKVVSEDQEEEEERILTDESDSSEDSDIEEDEGEISESKNLKKNEYIEYEAESDDEDEDSGDEELNEKRRMESSEFLDDEAEETDADDEDSREGDLDIDEKSKEMDDSSCETPEQKTTFSKNMYSDSQSSLIPAYQPGGGMLHGGSELSQCDEDSILPKNLLSPALPLSLDLSPATKMGNNEESQQAWDLDLNSPEEANNGSNFVPCFPENGNFDLNDAYEFCSGKFPDEGSGSFDCRSPDSQAVSCNSRQGITGETEKESRQVKKLSRVAILADDGSEDETTPALDNEDEAEDITTNRISSGESDDEDNAPIKDRKKRKHLKFSDDEEVSSDSHDSDNDDVEEKEAEDIIENEQKEKEVIYDSEEELINPGEFFEKEAELSGSEEWSGDEDEGGLDDYEKEDGDADKLDEHKVRSDLEKIHMRTLRDDDERQVRLLQEILFEDGDLHDDGPKRQKNFRWKDIGGFYDEDDRTDLFKPQDDEQEEDEQSAKIRHEKELFWLKMKSRRDEMGLDDVSEHGSSLLKLGKIVMEKSTRMTVSKEKVKASNADVDEIMKTPFALTNQRGSFLSRNEEFLSRLAKFTANATDNILGPKHSKNFVFASKSPEKAPPSKENSQPKRKNGSPKNEKNKKPCLEADIPKVSVLDYL